MAKRKTHDQPEQVRRDGGLCANFVNTLSSKRRSFSSYSELVAWSAGSGAIATSDVERLERTASARPEDAAAVVERAVALRAVLQRMFQARMAKRRLPSSDLEALNAELENAGSARRLIATDGSCEWAWGDRGGDDLDRMLWRVVSSAAEVLTTKYYFQIRQCDGEDCDLMFVDRTPGNPRRWCGKRCGGRVNSNRHYRRRVKPERLANERALLTGSSVFDAGP